MPTYRSADVHMRLIAAPLQASITHQPEKKRGTVAVQHTETAERVLLSNSNPTVKEEVVPFPGDHRAFNVGFLAGAPALMVKAQGEPDWSYPTALALHISLGDNSFNRCPPDLLVAEKDQQLMIDVFFNGMLVGTKLVGPGNKTKGRNQREQLLSGTRVDLLIERPWVLKSGKSPATGTDRPGVQNRWMQLRNAIMREADERGFDGSNARPPSAQYLESLANMDIPDSVFEMQHSGSYTFGVIDVIVTMGTGRKVYADGHTSGIHYLKVPSRLVDSRYRPRRPGGPDAEAVASMQLQGDHDAEGERDSDFEMELSGMAPVSMKQHPIATVSESFDAVQAPLLPIWEQSSSLEPGTWGFKYQPASSTETINPAQLEFMAHGRPGILNFAQQTMSGTLDSTSSHSPVSQFRGDYGTPRKANPNTNGLPYPRYAMGMSDRGTFTKSGSETDITPLAQDYGNGLIRFDGTPTVPSPAQYQSFIRPVNPLFTYLGPVVVNGPGPPVGMFSTSLPRSKPHVPPGLGNVDPALTALDRPCHTHSLISRVVIYGAKGVPLVDHRWAVPQKVPAKSKPCLSTPYLEQTHPEKKLCRVSLAERASLIPASSEAITQRNSEPAPLFPNQILQASPNYFPAGGTHGRFSPPSTEHFAIFDRLRHVGLAVPNYSTTKFLSNEVNTAVPSSSGPGPTDLLRHYSTHIIGATPNDPNIRIGGRPRSSFLGVHGPKMNSYIFEDPDEVIREMRKKFKSQDATLKRSAAPVTHITPSHGSERSQQNLTSPRAGCIANPPGVPQNLIHARSASSSPLSSVDEPLLRRQDLVSPPVAEGKPRNEHMMSPSPRSLASDSPQRVQSLTEPQQTTPASSPIQHSQDTTGSAPCSSAASPRHSVDTFNPPLNRNCVICYAEDGPDGTPTLRQVRSERPGSFREAMVMVGVRFFVPGC